MPKSLKYIIFTLLFLSTFILVIPQFIPSDFYRGRIIDAVKKATGRDLVIDGKITLSLLPRPQININKAKLASIDGAQMPWLCEVEKLTATLAVSQLLTGNIIVSCLELTAPEINLETLANNISNWEFSPSPAAAQKPQNLKAKNTDSPNLAALVQRLVITNGKLRHITGHNTTIINDIDIDVKIASDITKLTKFAVYCNFLDQNFDLKGDISSAEHAVALNFQLKSLETVLDVHSITNPKTLTYQGTMQLHGQLKHLTAIIPQIASLDALSPSYQMTANIAGDIEKITIDTIDLSSGKIQASGAINYSLKTDIFRSKLLFNPGNITIELNTVSRSQPPLAVKLSIQSPSLRPLLNLLKVDADQLPVLSRPFAFSVELSDQGCNYLLQNIHYVLDDAVMLTGGIKLENLTQQPPTILYDLRMKLLGIKPLLAINDLQLTGQTTNNGQYVSTDTCINFAKVSTSIKGDISLAGKLVRPLNIKSSGDNLGQTLHNLLKIPVNQQLGRFDLSASIQSNHANKLTITLNQANFNIGPSSTSVLGSAVLTLGNNRPNLAADLTVSAIKLDDLGSSTKPGGGTLRSNAPNTNQPGMWSKAAIDLSALNLVDFDLKLVIGKLTTGSLIFDQAKANLVLQNGLLALRSLSTNFCGGKLTAEGSLASDNNQSLNLTVNLARAQLKNIMPGQRQAIKITQGNCNFSTKLKSQGSSLHQYINNLSGQINFDSIDGRLSGIDLQKAMRALTKIKDISSVLGVLNQAFSGGETTFKSLEGNLVVEQGIAKISRFKLDAQGLAATATGHINLPQYQLDVISKVNFDVKNLPPLNVRLHGKLNNVQHQLDIKALTKHIAGNVLTNILDRGGSDQGGAADMIKGIMGHKRQPKTTDQQPPAGDDDPARPREKPADPADIIKKNLQKLFRSKK